MRILFMGNNWVGWQVLQWLLEQGENIVGLVLHPEDKRKYSAELLALAGDIPIFDGSSLRDPQTLDAIAALQADIGLSIYFGYILRAEFLSLFPAGCINLHPSLLPYNRGAHPNVWSIVDQTPAGVTLHYIDAGVDTGAIIRQQEVPVEPIDTGATLYRKLDQAALALFKAAWGDICAGRVTAVNQSQSGLAGTEHRVRDLEKIDEIHLDRSYTARELINILRARTFPPYKGAFFKVDGRKVYLRLELFYDDQVTDSNQQ